MILVNEIRAGALHKKQGIYVHGHCRIIRLFQISKELDDHKHQTARYSERWATEPHHIDQIPRQKRMTPVIAISVKKFARTSNLTLSSSACCIASCTTSWTQSCTACPHAWNFWKDQSWRSLRFENVFKASLRRMQMCLHSCQQGSVLQCMFPESRVAELSSEAWY